MFDFCGVHTKNGVQSYQLETRDGDSRPQHYNDMKRREFIKTSVAASTLIGLSCAGKQDRSASGQTDSKAQEYYALRVYHLKAGANHDLLHGYLEKAVVPGLNRLGIKPVGVFAQQERTEAAGAGEVRDASSVLVLIPYPSIAAFATSDARLHADPQFQSAGADYLQSLKTNPAFERIDSWLMLAFAGMPKVELPAYCREKKPRMFEIRTYESYSELKALKKVEMFNSGEIETMRDVGLGPIFFGQALIGSNLPHLTYMLSAEDQAGHKTHWGAFGQHATWKKLKDDPQYADTVSKIYNRFLVPTAYSQI